MNEFSWIIPEKFRLHVQHFQTDLLTKEKKHEEHRKQFFALWKLPRYCSDSAAWIMNIPNVESNAPFMNTAFHFISVDVWAHFNIWSTQHRFIVLSGFQHMSLKPCKVSRGRRKTFRLGFHGSDISAGTEWLIHGTLTHGSMAESHLTSPVVLPLPVAPTKVCSQRAVFRPLSVLQQKWFWSWFFHASTKISHKPRNLVQLEKIVKSE